MKHFLPLIVVMAVVLFGLGYAEMAIGQEGDQEKEMSESLRRKTPSGQYMDPASFFRFHGYVTLSYSAAEKELGSEEGMTPQILIGGLSSRTGENEGGFKNDAALFVGGEPFEGVSSVIELHFVGNALDPVITEAKLIWDVIEREGGPFTFRVIGGRFWWPFGIHNEEWFSAINKFSVISLAASEVVPAHYNEVGIAAEGEIELTPRMGANYVFSVGNGVPSFELMDNVRSTAFDTNKNRTLTSRVALVFSRAINLDLGFSAATGDLRSGEDTSIDPADARRYEADFYAMGPDIVLRWRELGLRGYYYMSREDLANAPLSGLDRDGLTVEPMYTFHVQAKRLKRIILHGRYSFSNEDTLAGTTFRRLQYGFGAEFQLANAFSTKVGYIIQEEKRSALEVDNDVFTAAFTAEF